MTCKKQTGLDPRMLRRHRVGAETCAVPRTRAEPSRARLAWAIAAAAACWISAAQAAGPTTPWVEAWYSAPVAPEPIWSCNQVRAFNDQTVRQVVRLEAGGNRIRVRLSNELGLSPLKVSEVRVALSSPNGVTEAATDDVVTFSGKDNALIEPGKARVSDPVDLKVRRFQNLAISIYFSGQVYPSGHLHQLLLSPSGDHAAESVWAQAHIEQAPAIVSGVEVEPTAARHVLVAFGDSITEGWCATQGTHRDYPEQLARLLAQSPRSRQWVVINSGISGNQVLRDGAGPKALSRFGRDALDIPGVRAIVLLEAINDIGGQDGPQGRHTLEASTIIDAYRDLIRRAHARRLKIFLGTLTPYKGAGYWSPAGEKVREQVNAWIRQGRGFDGVIHFDRALRDPAHPLRFIGADQCGFNLHPNDAGYHLMAETVSRELFARGAPLASGGG